MLMDTFSAPLDRRRTTRLLLLAIIVLSLPCYCLGFVLLAYAPAGDDDVTPRSTSPTLAGATPTPFATSTLFGFTATPTQFGGVLGPTPGQLYLRTNTPFVFPTYAYPTNPPSWTPPPQPTAYPTLTRAPSITPSPTLPTTTQAPPPTETPTPSETPSETPTDTPPILDEATPTQETLSE